MPDRLNEPGPGQASSLEIAVQRLRDEKKELTDKGDAQTLLGRKGTRPANYGGVLSALPSISLLVGHFRSTLTWLYHALPRSVELPRLWHLGRYSGLNLTFSLSPSQGTCLLHGFKKFPRAIHLVFFPGAAKAGAFDHAHWCSPAGWRVPKKLFDKRRRKQTVA